MRTIDNRRAASLLWVALAVALSGSPTRAAEPKTPPPTPYGAVPSERQLEWHRLERYAFIHFGINTFTDREWGYGDESPEQFDPTDFDADQIVGELKAGGFRAVILTCKHHDGFCLWPTKTTAHNVSASPFRGGQGDVVQEIAAAAERAGLAFGIYLSPWDRNSRLYGEPEYVTDVYRPQLRELLTRYPNAFEVWFDGANGGDGYYGGARETRRIDRATYYDWPTTWQMVRDLAPGAVIFSDVGPGCRWVGNERGVAGDPCWATFTPTGPDGSDRYGPGMSNYDDAPTGTRHGRLWLPAEADVSIRPGWFWHASENDRVRSPANLMDLYLQSVGRGANLLLNVPPDRRGLVHDADSESLRRFGEHLDATFAENLAMGARLDASHVRGGDTPRFGPQRLLDDDPWSAWTTGDFETSPSVELTLPTPRRFNLIRLREDVRLGQRVAGVAVDAQVDGEWKTLAEAESIGACRLWRVPETTTDRVRIRVTRSPVCPALSDFGLYAEPPLPPSGASDD